MDERPVSEAWPSKSKKESRDKTVYLSPPVKVTKGITVTKIPRQVYKTRDIRIAGGLGKGIKDRLFRVGHMGPMVGEADIDAVLDGLAAFLAER